MPLDPNIILSAKPAVIPQVDPLERYGKSLALQTLMGQHDLQDYTLKSAKRTDERKTALDALLAQDPSAKSLLQGGFLDEAIKLDKATQEKAQAEATTAEKNAQAAKHAHEVAMGQLAHGAALFDTVKDQATWDSALRLGVLTGTFKPDWVAGLPKEFNPQVVSALKAIGITHAQQLEAQNRDATLAETTRSHRASEVTAGITANAAARNATTNEKKLDQEKIQYITTPEGIVAVDRNAKGGGQPSGAYVVGANGKVLGGKANEDLEQRKRDAKDVENIALQVGPLLDKAHGSYIGTGMGVLGKVVGMGSDEQSSDAQLKVLAGALTSKMPKMSGPQSDKDVMLYKEMAGQLGDSTLPIRTRKDALNTVLELNRKYGEAQSSGASGGWMPAPAAKPEVAKAEPSKMTDDELKKALGL